MARYIILGKSQLDPIQFLNSSSQFVKVFTGTHIRIVSNIFLFDMTGFVINVWTNAIACKLFPRPTQHKDGRNEVVLISLKMHFEKYLPIL